MSIISNAKEIADLIKKLDDVELYRKIIELEGEIIDLHRKNHSLEEHVVELTRSLVLKEKLRWEKPFYFMEGDKDPYCPRCYEADSLTIHLKDLGKGGSDHRWDCPKCDNMILTSPHNL